MTSQQLEEMGFTPEEACKAIAATDGSLESAIEFIGKEQDRDSDSSAQVPLSEQESKKRLEELQNKAAQKRKEHEAQEVRDRRESDRINKLQDQQMREIKRELELQQAKTDAAARRRQQQEDKRYREKLRSQIEQDRRERASARAALQTRGQSVSQTKLPNAQVVSKAGVRIQAQFNGKRITKSYETDISVAQFAQEAASELGIEGEFSLHSRFPTQVTKSGDTRMLGEAGLANSMVEFRLI